MKNYQALGRRDARKALIDAVLAHDDAVVELILSECPDIVDARNSHGRTPLSEAVGVGSLALVRRLIDAGADPKQYNHGGTALIDIAAYQGNREIAEFLRQKGCTVTPYHEASLGNLDAIRQRIKWQPSLIRQFSQQNLTLLHHASAGNHPEVCDLLISKGATIDAYDRHAHTPLCHAVERNSLEAARLLVENGANINQSAGHFNGTVLHRAIMLRHVEMSLLLIHSGSDPNTQDFSGKSALHAAVASGNLQIAQAVLNTSVDTSLKTRKTKQQKGNESALDYARRLNKRKMVTLLEKYVSSIE